MQENTALINECNDLRKENLSYQRRVEGLVLRAKDALRERSVLLLQMQVWYRMVWYGMVSYGMVWYGMVWYGMVRHAIAVGWMLVTVTVTVTVRVSLSCDVGWVSVLSWSYCDRQMTGSRRLVEVRCLLDWVVKCETCDQPQCGASWIGL
jgi:hypothetical protein